MLSILGGFEADGLWFLQAEDAAAEKWNRHTLGIGFFPCFTLKVHLRDCQFVSRPSPARSLVHPYFC